MSSEGEGPRILVFGAAGFLGRRLMAALGPAAVGADVLAADGVEHVVDLRDLAGLRAVVETVGPDAVVNVAYVLTGQTLDAPHMALEVNIVGIDRLFQACMDLGVPRVVYASSEGVYGEPSRYGDEPIAEDADRWPWGLYGWMKHLNEVCAELYNTRTPTRFIGARVGSMQGRGKGGAFNPMTLLVDAARESRRVVLPWARDHRFGFVHVDDVATALGALATADDPRWTIYNVGSERVTMEEFAAVAMTVAPELEVEFEYPGRDIRHVAGVSWDRLRDEFGLPRRTIEEWFREECGMSVTASAV
jgi:UDP-glucose 4-epimerase